MWPLLYIDGTHPERYESNWESLDKRPIPKWYDEAKIGIMLHWGVYSVPAFESEWFWSAWLICKKPQYKEFMKRNYEPNFTYEQFANDFTADLFDPTQWALLFRDSGARYVVMTAKHHDGFTLWPSKQSSGWNSMDLGPKRDLVKDLAAAVRSVPNMKFGVYYSLLEWFNQKYIDDKSTSFSQHHFVDSKVRPELLDLVNEYKPDIIWSHGGWEASSKYWKSEEFLSWLYNDSPVRDTVVTNDHWGIDSDGRHGGFHSCKPNSGTHKWEKALNLDRSSWGYRNDLTLNDCVSSKDLIKEIVTTVSCNGNIVINVGPTKYGTISPIFEERLRDMGRWLKINGEGIYGSAPWTYESDLGSYDVWYTKSQQSTNGNTIIYAFVLEDPYDTNEIVIYPLGKGKPIHPAINRTFSTNLRLFDRTTIEPLHEKITEVVLLGMEDTKISWTAGTNKLHIVFPPYLKGEFAWTFKITMK